MLPKGVCFKGEASNVLVPSNCNLFTHGALRSSWELVEPCPCVLDPEPEFFCACLTRAFPNPEALHNWKNLSEQEREPTTNSTHIWCRCQDSNPGHIGRRRVLSHHSTIPGSTTISSLAILDFRAVLYCAWAKDEKSSQSRGSDDRNSVSMARARERNIPTPTAQQATIDLLKQPLLEINYFIEVMVIQ